MTKIKFPAYKQAILEDWCCVQAVDMVHIGKILKSNECGNMKYCYCYCTGAKLLTVPQENHFTSYFLTVMCWFSFIAQPYLHSCF